MSLVTKDSRFIELKKIAFKKGCLTIDDILKYANDCDLPLEEVDRICGLLQDKGIIILEEEEQNISIKDNTIVDKSKLDYEKIFKEVIKIEPCLKQYIEEIRKIPPPQIKEEANLVHQAKDGNPYARDRIIKMYLRVVVRIALYYYDKYSLPLDETIQDGNVGLVKAIEKMPVHSEQRFSTYAPWWIRQSIERSTLGLTNNLYLPYHLKQYLYDIITISKDHFCEECLKSNKCNAFIEQIYNKTGLDNKSIEDLLNAMQENVNIDECITNDELQDIFNDNGEYENDMIKGVASKQLLQLLNTVLSERESTIIKYRYGFYDGKERTLEQIGKILGVTRERIRQIEAKAFRKLKRTRKLKDFR